MNRMSPIVVIHLILWKKMETKKTMLIRCLTVKWMRPQNVTLTLQENKS
ncbi:hypothetical protein RDI58_001617 [Solanum bulbocastanum]|uniref:Uncharacterized protein n=1 Tax=Solanum bulbocastanum TaxID=147425 RepID=A0AAN8YNC0_SOLBU